MTRKATDKGRPTGNPVAYAEPWDLVADAYTADMVSSMEPVAREALRPASTWCAMRHRWVWLKAGELVGLPNQLYVVRPN